MEPAAELNTEALATALDAALPQTQCTRCGYPDCRAYAEAMATGAADINRCPPGGTEGIVRLARISGRPTRPLDAERGVEAPRRIAVIDEDWCIGCDLCLPVCPVDCIEMVKVSGTRTGWDAWSAAQADEARRRYAFHRLRSEREQRENDERLAAKAQAKLADLQLHSSITDADVLQRKRAVIEAALARAKARP